ncbi:replication initiation protein [Vibrio mediterranei]|uniref:replication initiation protein n=1 Tax=Vibrio mediterranei TaxID=689 RepID=UPI00406862BF
MTVKDKVANAEKPLPTSVVRKYHSGLDSHIKSNDIVFASMALTPKMCDVLSLLFTKMRAQDWFLDGDTSSDNHAIPHYQFEAKEIAAFFKIKSSKNVASLLRSPVRSLTETVIGIEQENGDFDYSPLFSRCKYEKGVLTIIPNNELRNSYIAKAKTNGYALISNDQYLALRDAHSKKMLDLLSRFKTGQKLYPISIKKLQVVFGVYGRDGKLLMPTYKSPKTFLKRLIASSLKTISESEESRARIVIEESEHQGTLGFEFVNDDEGDDKIDENTRIRFLYSWLASFTDENIAEAERDMERLIQLNAENIKEHGGAYGLDLHQYVELVDALKIVMSESEEKEQFYQPIYDSVVQKLKDFISYKEYEQKKEVESATEKILHLSTYFK